MTNEQYYDLIVPYQDAMNLLKARLDVLNHSMYGNKSHPIHNIQFRIKQKASIEEKLKRMDLQGSFINAKEHLQDIAGIRVICYFEKDVELLAEQLRKQSDLILVKEKDYITNPKPNENSGISAYIHGDQTVHHGSLVKIRIGKNITLPNGERIPENTFVYGTCSVAGERMNIKVTRAQVGNKLLTCNLSAYGTDGNIGLHVPGSVQRQENKKASGKGLKKIGNVLGSGVNIATGGLAGSLAQTTTEGLIDAVADGSSKAVQQTKIFLPNNEQIYLK